MSRDAAVLLGLVIVGAAWLVSHLHLAVRVVRAAKLRPWLRVLSFVPPLTPVLGFMSGLRLLGGLWLLLALVYIVLRSLA
ncbi:MAG: hypothetical protein OXT09_35165 [Myxococcales bacterium]|nr:hypothetical protein [Myxococcales bacterium]